MRTVALAIATSCALSPLPVKFPQADSEPPPEDPCRELEGEYGRLFHDPLAFGQLADSLRTRGKEGVLSLLEACSDEDQAYYSIPVVTAALFVPDPGRPPIHLSQGPQERAVREALPRFPVIEIDGLLYHMRPSSLFSHGHGGSELLPPLSSYLTWAEDARFDDTERTPPDDVFSSIDDFLARRGPLLEEVLTRASALPTGCMFCRPSAEKAPRRMSDLVETLRGQAVRSLGDVGRSMLEELNYWPARDFWPPLLTERQWIALRELAETMAISWDAEERRYRAEG